MLVGLLTYYIPLFLAPEAPTQTHIPPGYEVAKATFLPNDTVSDYVPGRGFAFAQDYGNGTRRSVAAGGDIELVRYLIEN